jgi:hypothetical protein
MKAMAVSKKKPYNQQDKRRRPVENVLSVTQTSKEKKKKKKTDLKFSSGVNERHFL